MLPSFGMALLAIEAISFFYPKLPEIWASEIKTGRVNQGRGTILATNIPIQIERENDQTDIFRDSSR